MSKEPLYPHVPKKKEPLFPHRPGSTPQKFAEKIWHLGEAEAEIDQIIADLNLLREEKVWIDTFKTKGASLIHLQTGDTATIISPPEDFTSSNYADRAMQIKWADGSEMVVDSNDFAPSSLQKQIAEITHGKPIPEFPKPEVTPEIPTAEAAKEQNKCFKVDPEFEREERQLVRTTADLLAQEFCPAEPINIIKDEHLEKTGQLAREFQRPLGEKIFHFIGLNPKAVKNALELEKQTRGDGVWALAWTLSHELGHYVWGESEKLANEYAERILKRVEKKIPGWEAL